MGKLYVDCNAGYYGTGSKEAPFRTINEAADVAVAGDEVIVAPGIYRENVNPKNAGLKDQRIVYRAAKKGEVVISGAEVVKGWEVYSKDVYVKKIPAAFFGEYNPYTTLVFGDWLVADNPFNHTGEVYLNGKSLYEVRTLDEVMNPIPFEGAWDRDFSVYKWYTKADFATGDICIYANFHGADPNEECVEINVRRQCFYPQKEHVDYITLSGFVVTMAATQWAPPTALQEGMIGPHWSKGWIIEDCDVSNSKCSGISLGKYKQENNDNKWSKEKLKDGAQTQRRCALIARHDGWDRDTVGSHTVRNCEIHDCGQTGIVGNLGCVFSVIENNHIHNINNKRNLTGAETGGIKLHAAIDVIIRGNDFHHCTRGIWLDWEAQGTRVSGNLFHDNCMPYEHLLTEKNAEGLGLGEDIFVEISHGPTLVDNNVFLSERALKLPTQGVAFVHNYIAGSICAIGRGVKNGSVIYDSTRYTPVHAPHSTQIIDFMSVLHGDMRFYNNIFDAQKVRDGLCKICTPMKDGEWDDGNLECGTAVFEGYMTYERWLSEFDGYCGEGSPKSRDRYYMPLPVEMAGNVYLNGAKNWSCEKNACIMDDVTLTVKYKENADGWSVSADGTDALPRTDAIVDSDTLGESFEANQRYESPNGEIIVFDTDIDGNKRSGTVMAGPWR